MSSGVVIIITGILVASACAVLGCFLVLRKMAMLTDAISHAILPGIVVAYFFAHGPNILAGFIGAIGGLFLTFYTYTGDAALASGNAYTLFSIAAVVMGGVSLFGGKGSAIGAVFGALAFRTIGDLLFVFDLEPLWQPLFQGLILLAAVSFGAFALLRVRNKLEWFQ